MKYKFNISFLFAIGLFLSTLVFSPFILDYTLTPRLFSSIFLLLICLINFIHSKKTGSIKIDLPLFSYFLFVVFCLLSIIWCNTKSEAFLEGIKLLSAFGIFSFASYFFIHYKNSFLNLLCKISIVLVVIEFIFVLFQLTQIQQFNKDSLYLLYGINSHKNLVSSFLVLQLFFCAAGIILFDSVWKKLSLLALLLNLSTLCFLQTKAVWFGLFVFLLTATLLLFFSRSTLKFNLKFWMITSFMLVNVFVLFLFPKIIEKGIRFNLSESRTIEVGPKTELDNERLLLWAKSYHMFNEHSAIGVGVGNWQIQFPNATLKNLWRAEDLNYTFQRPHNDFLWVLAETGIVGFNLYIIFLLGVALSLIKILSEKTLSKNEHFQIIFCAATLLGFLQSVVKVGEQAKNS